MKEFRWNVLKSTRLKRTRGVSFEEIVQGELLGIQEHSSRSDQLILVFGYKGHVWAVPFVFGEDHVFLKTLYRSRKYQKIYKKE